MGRFHAKWSLPGSTAESFSPRKVNDAVVVAGLGVGKALSRGIAVVLEELYSSNDTWI